MEDTSLTQYYDIIGDIHGHADALEALLLKLGYEPYGDVYRHSSHKVIFLGDFIDRGHQQREVIQLVKPMIEQGSAFGVMGNHEYNAICYTTLGKNGKPLREHCDKNTKQHAAFLAAYPDPDERAEIINWFKTLPVYMDTGDIRVIHASWNEEALRHISPFLKEDKCLQEEFYELCRDEDSLPYQALETLLKGPEIALPDGVTYKDKDGHVRGRARIKWWTPKNIDVKKRLHLGSELQNDHKFASLRIDSEHHYPHTDKPIFFGHYWLSDKEPTMLSENCACLDYSIARGGKLVAYQWRGEKKLKNNHFVWCK